MKNEVLRLIGSIFVLFLNTELLKGNACLIAHFYESTLECAYLDIHFFD